MPEGSDIRMHCPSCGKRLRLPPGTSPGKEFRCPRCAARVRAPGGAPGAEVKELLPTCPVCARGKVVAASGADDDLYVCTHCRSRVSETLLGFVYLDVDPRYVHVSEEAKNQPYTRQRLIEMAEQAAKTGQSGLGGKPVSPPPKPKPAPSTPSAKPKAPPEETPEDKADTGPVITGEDLLAEMSSTGKGDDDGNDADLWWDVDEEELAKRGGPPPPPGADKPKKAEGEVTLDDILGDIGH